MQIHKSALWVLDKLERQGYEAYTVGGCVRDTIMGREPSDWDVCTSALPHQVAICFKGYRVIETGLAHGTVTVVSEESEHIEVTTYRHDGKYIDNRRPERVEFVRSLKDDLSRREFTINAMAYNPRTGFVDFFGGERDIRDKLIRSVGEPAKRFGEDALRILRALRFASRLGFTLDAALSKSVHACKNLLLNVSDERLRDELCGILVGDAVREILLEYVDVLQVFMPELGEMIGCEQQNPHHEYNVWQHTVESVAAAPVDVIIRMVMLLHDIGKPGVRTTGQDGVDHFYGHAHKSEQIARDIMRRLRFSGEEIKEVCRLVRWHDVQIMPDSVLKWMNRLEEKGFAQLLAVQRADCMAQSKNFRGEKLDRLDKLEARYKEVLAEKLCFVLKDLAVDGHDLMAAGVLPGPQVGHVLDRLLSLVMEGELENEKTTLLREAKKISKMLAGQ